VSVHHPAGVTRPDGSAHESAAVDQRGDKLPTLQRLIELASELATSNGYGVPTRSPARTGTAKRLAGGASGQVQLGS
jgi:hypothetical protein